MDVEIFNQLVRDGMELQYHDDQYETACFLKNLAKKYDLKFDESEYTSYDFLINKLRTWAKAYYHDDNPIATDEEYDLIYHKVMKFEMRHDIVNEDSPTQFVGWKE